ncbi:NYN domain-containing protein [Patescibacteria group bacterium]|nr:NYN domain-containing protein [Patescibacteria group bacterium]MBU3923177.1 NYN domain-containing protein [Patescibacteria group bacterium]
MSQKIKENNYAFVDSQNLNLAIKDRGWELDFAKFYIYIKDKYKVTKSFLFIGYVPGNEALYTFLQKTGYIVIFKPTLEYKKKEENFIKGNVDAELVLHTMIEYPNYDKAIIVSGDGDFHCLIEYLEKQRKLFRIIIPNRRKYSALLRKFRKYFIYIDDLNHKLGKTKERE